jgi:hypothetical protein
MKNGPDDLEFVQAKTSKQQRSKQRRNPNGGGEKGRGGSGRQSNNTTHRPDPFRKKGWSKPTSTNSNHLDLGKANQDLASSLPYPDEVSEEIASMVSSRLQDADDDITSALASTAAVTFLASAAAAATTGYVNGYVPATNNKEEPDEMQASDFASMMKRQNMADLMADFGEQDVDWKKKEVIDTSDSKVLEDGDSDDDDGGSHPAMSSTITSTTPSRFPSRLAPHGKSPVHVVLESFGYIHGAPQLQSQSWSPYSQPLPALDIRSLTEPIPTHLLFHDGLRSGIVKRMLREQDVNLEGMVARDYNADDNGTTVDFKNLQEYARRQIAQQWIYPKLVEAQTDGQHGYVNPVTMRICIGSHVGRHRSVVVVEWVAIELRKLLRQNNQGLLSAPVSVETVHRDIDKKVPAKATEKGRRRKEDDDEDGDQV